MKAIYNSNNRITDLRQEYNSANCIEVSEELANEITDKINNNYSVFINSDNSLTYKINLPKLISLKQLVIDKELRVVADHLIYGADSLTIEQIGEIQAYIVSLNQYVASLKSEEDVYTIPMPEKPLFMQEV